MDIEDVKKGNRLISGDIDIKIIARIDDIVFYCKNKYGGSWNNEYDELHANFMTKKQLKFRGFHFMEDK